MRGMRHNCDNGAHEIMAMKTLEAMVATMLFESYSLHLEI
jgi:hypothetical protein